MPVFPTDATDLTRLLVVTDLAWEIRAFFRDPDGHLFEISQRKLSTDR